MKSSQCALQLKEHTLEADKVRNDGYMKERKRERQKLKRETQRIQM